VTRFVAERGVYASEVKTGDILATLTRFSAQMSRETSFLDRNSPNFVYNFLGQFYESIWISGEDMHQ
jgi:hypothetical protein